MTLYTTTVDFQGKPTEAIRVKVPRKKPVSPNAPDGETERERLTRTITSGKQLPPADTVDDDAEIPF